MPSLSPDREPYQIRIYETNPTSCVDCERRHDRRTVELLVFSEAGRPAGRRLPWSERDQLCGGRADQRVPKFFQKTESSLLG